MRSDEDLLHGPADHLANYLGVTVKTVNNWKSGRVSLPEPVRKLLRLRFDGDAAALLGSGWEGFYFQNGELFIPGWRYGFSPEQIRAMFFQVQEVRSLRQALLDAEILGRGVVGQVHPQAAGNDVRFYISEKRDHPDQAHK